MNEYLNLSREIKFNQLKYTSVLKLCRMNTEKKSSENPVDFDVRHLCMDINAWIYSVNSNGHNQLWKNCMHYQRK